MDRRGWGQRFIFIICCALMALLVSRQSAIADELRIERLPAPSYCNQFLDSAPKESWRYYASIPRTWAAAFELNMRLIGQIFWRIKFRPMPGGLVSIDHPWVTGLNSQTQKPIWLDNVIFRTAPNQTYEESDEAMLLKTGRFLAAMVKKSAATLEHPQGLPAVAPDGITTLRRMPHAINYIHGSAHYNSGWLIFNSIREAFYYFSDPSFRKEVERFAQEQKREITLLFRDREYDPDEYRHLGGFLRTIFPFYSNTNGPKDLVHWGSKAPYAIVNMITGHFINDLDLLASGSVGAQKAARSAIPTAAYFQGQYTGVRDQAVGPEIIFAEAIQLRVNLRPKRKGNVFFVDKEELDQRAAQRALLRQPIKLIQETFLEHPIEVHDLSGTGQVPRSGVVPMPADFNPEQDLLLGLSNHSKIKRTRGHIYLRAGEAELHASVAFRNPTFVQEPNDDRVGAWVFFVIKDVPAETVKRVEAEAVRLVGTRTLSCTRGLCAALNGGQIDFRKPILGNITSALTMRSILLHGFTDEHGAPLRFEIYKTVPDSVEDIYRQALIQDFKFAAVSPLAVLVGGFLKLVNFRDPAKVVF